MKIILTILLLSFAHCLMAGEPDSIVGKQRNAYGIGFSPTRKNNIYGLALGLIGSEAMCGDSILKKSHGIHIQLTGQGIFVPFNHRFFLYENCLSSDSAFMVDDPEQGRNKAFHNGLLISGFGTFTYRTNGVSLSGLASTGHDLNGFSFNLLSNRYAFIRGMTFALNNLAYSVKGVQLGLINKTMKLRGFQLGLWNVNEKRKLPFVNWCFTD